MKKKVAFLLKNLDGGGAEKVASTIVSNLSEDEYEKYLILDNEEIIKYDYDATLITLDIVNKNNIIGRLSNFLKKIYRVKKLKKQYDFDVVISFLSGSNLINILTKTNEKNIISIRNYLSREHSNLRGKILNLFSKHLYKRADLVTIVSKQGKEDLIKNFNVPVNKIKVIYNPYDLEKIRKLSLEDVEEQNKFIFNKPTIINIGRLSPQKGQKYCLNMLKEILKSKDVNLVILGEGKLEEELKKYAIKLGISDNVFFLGFKENPYKYISKSKVLLLTSLFEGFPNVVLEAMSCGVPVISTDCKSGPREIITQKDINEGIDYKSEQDFGFLIPDFLDQNEGEEVAIIQQGAQQVINILKNEEIYNKLKEKSYQRSKDFTLISILNEWKEIL